MMIVTNNPILISKLSNFKILYLDGSYKDVLQRCYKEVIENQYVLLTHPLSGSIKPNETYYKSILIKKSSIAEIDLQSINYLNNALDVYDKFINNHRHPNWSQKILDDFAVVDYFLIKGAIDNSNFY